jgi:transmembrane protein
MRMLGGMTVVSEAGTDTPALVAAALGHPATLLVGRVCVASPFLVAGMMKLCFWQAGVAEMAKTGLHPAWIFNIAALVTELVGSTLVVLNRKAWLGAGALGIFTVLSTFLAHRFWDFSGDIRTEQMNSFFEHATISASFIFVVVAGLRQRQPVPVSQAISRNSILERASDVS